MTTEHLPTTAPGISATDDPVLRLGGPADLLQAVPYLLGFHPAASLVVIGLNGGRLIVTVRLDLADLTDPRVLTDAVDAVHRGGARDLVGVVYDECRPVAREQLPWHGLADALDSAAAASGCAVLDTLLVSGGRWWSYSCRQAECCPPEGRALPEQTTVIEAAATYAGLVALPDRAALAAVLEPLPDAQRDRLAPLVEQHEHAVFQATLDGRVARHERSVKRALFAAARRADAAGAAAALADEEVARFGVALCGYPVRDSLWMAVDDGRLDGRPLWRELARRLPAPYDAAPLFLFGWCSWRAGSGAIAGIAAEQAVRSDPGYSAADLLLAALARGLDPGRLPRLRLPRSG
jgi:hypothetical protein